MNRSAIIAIAWLAGCRSTIVREKGSMRAGPTRTLEISASYFFPPGAFNQYVVRQMEGGRIEAYVVDAAVPSGRTPLASSPALARYVDRIDSLIVHRLPSDTTRVLAPNRQDICGDGFSYGARLTEGSRTRTVGVASCGDNSPGSAGRTIVLQGVLDSLARLVRPK